MRYLDKGHYLGIDKRIELIIYGVVVELGLDDYKLKRPRFVISDEFEFDRFDLRPSFAVAQSLFTHLAPDDIVLCLRNLRSQAVDGCRLFATFREVSDPQADLRIRMRMPSILTPGRKWQDLPPMRSGISTISATGVIREASASRNSGSAPRDSKKPAISAAILYYRSARSVTWADPLGLRVAGHKCNPGEDLCLCFR